MKNLKEETLTFTETEAIRLIDLEEESQEKAAKKMKISQPTLSRLLKSGRKKLADSIINSKAIKIEGGRFKMIGKGRRGGGRFMAGKGGRGRMGGNKAGAGPGGVCVCPKCGKEVPQIRGQPCNQRKCPKCGNIMARR